MKKGLKVYVFSPERDFLKPYFGRALQGFESVDTPEEADRCIMISSVDVYAAAEGNLIGEDSPVDTSSRWYALEQDFTGRCTACGRPSVILRSADVIGTGMTGWPRELAERIWKGSLMHFAGNEARVSVVHAVDVADAVAALAACAEFPAGVYNITDGYNPTFRDLVDSLAFRMKDKHVSTLSTKGQLWFGRLFYGGRLYRRFTTERTFYCAALCRVIDYKPREVTEYLRTHVYDDTSL